MTNEKKTSSKDDKGTQHNIFKDLGKRIADTEGLDIKEIIADVSAQMQGNKVSKAVSKMAHKFDDLAHKKPWYYMGAAAVSGLILGVVVRLTSKKHSK